MTHAPFRNLAALTALLVPLGLLGPGCDAYQKPNRPMPDLGLLTLDGTAITAASMKGTAWVINVWLPGCTACLREIPELEATRSEYGPQGVHFLALSLVEDPDTTQRAASAAGISMDVATATGPVMGALGLSQVPSTLFVSKDGRIVALASGERRLGFFQRRAQSLLTSDP